MSCAPINAVTTEAPDLSTLIRVSVVKVGDLSRQILRMFAGHEGPGMWLTMDCC